MSKKTELIRVLKDYKTKYEAVQVKKWEIDKSTLYTPEGRADAIDRLLAGFIPDVQEHHDRAIEIIDKGLANLSERWKKNSVGRLIDGGYQTGLSNVIKMLELGTIQTAEDLQNIIDTYKEDFNALATIKNIAASKNIVGVTFPVDNREYNRQLLNQLRKNIDQYISGESLKRSSKAWNAFNQGRTDVSASMDSMSEFVETRLGDDLELLS